MLVKTTAAESDMPANKTNVTVFFRGQKIVKGEIITVLKIIAYFGLFGSSVPITLVLLDFISYARSDFWL
jgi:hypothetical protein